MPSSQQFSPSWFVSQFFAVQNAEVATVTFFIWDFQMSLTLVVLIALIAGMLIGAGLGTWFRWRRRKARNTA